MLKLNDIQAAAYRQWLEQRRGEVPRILRQGAKNNRIRALAKDAPPFQRSKKVGLEHTQSNATIAKKLAALRRMYRLLIASKLGISANPFDADLIPPPPKHAGKKRPTEMVRFEKVMDVIKAAEDETPRRRRDQAILAALFGGGLRRGEIVALRVADFRRTPQGTCYFYLRSTKAKRDAEQAVPAWAAQILEGWVQQRFADEATPSDYLFPSYTGRGGRVLTRLPISASGVYKLFLYYCKKAGAGEFLTPHSARATAITKLLADGVPHREVQEFSRHSSVQMVELYDKRRIGVDQNPGRGLDFQNNAKKKR